MNLIQVYNIDKMKGGNNLNDYFTLKELRARKNKTQVEVAKDLNVSPQTYNSWENNPGIIKLSNLIKLCNYFDIKIGQIKV